MKKISTKVVSLIGAFLLTFSAVGCSPTTGSNAGSGNNEPQNVSYEVWSTYNTLKVMQDSAFNGNYEKLGNGISLKMAKNETESGSFYITNTGNAEISSFDLTAAELTNENGDKFPVDQMEVLAQKYVNVVSKSQGNTLKEYPLGMQPDPLVRIDLYKGEKEDKVPVGCNQGFTVDFKTTAETPAGIYTGTFELDVAGNKQEIPVSVEVWDYALPEVSQTGGAFLIYERQVMQGEGTSEIDEYWYPAYFEHALKYKASPYMVPNSLHGPSEFFASVKKYWDHPNFVMYGFPHQTFVSSTETSEHYWPGTAMGDENNEIGYYEACLYYFVQKSAEDGVNYLSRAYFYPYDEPANEQMYQTAIDWCINLNALFEKVSARAQADGLFADCDPAFTAECLNTLENIDIVITAGVEHDRMREQDFSFCPIFTQLEKPRYNQLFIEHEAKFDVSDTKWMYAHIRPNNPSPTLHIDDFLVSTRALKWVQKEYDVNAFLYYDYCSSLSGSVYQKDYHGENRYEIVNKSPGLSANGDGFLVYPAARYYGAEAPITSMRLMAYRDGMDDLDIMYLLEDIFAQYETYYGVPAGTFDFNQVMEGILERIVVEGVAIPSDALFEEARILMTEAILNAQKETNNFVYSLDCEGSTANYAFYTAPGYQVKVNGAVLNSTASGSGVKHTYTMDFANASLLTSVELVNTATGATKEMTLYENTATRAIDIMASSFTVSCSEGTVATKENNTLNVTVKSIDNDSDEEEFDRLFKNVYINLNGLPQFTVLEYDIRNNSNIDAAMTLIIYDVDGGKWSRDLTMLANSTYRVNFLNRLASGKPINRVQIKFENAYEKDGSFELLADRNIVLSNISVR